MQEMSEKAKASDPIRVAVQANNDWAIRMGVTPPNTGKAN
jgi:hypothetical protein